MTSQPSFLSIWAGGSMTGLVGGWSRPTRDLACVGWNWEGDWRWCKWVRRSMRSSMRTTMSWTAPLAGSLIVLAVEIASRSCAGVETFPGCRKEDLAGHNQWSQN